MGSDLHMSPPTPDERRIVRSGDHTAVYQRHTDGIYGDTRTWHRVLSMLDPNRAVLDALKTTMPLAKTSTLTPPVEYLPATMPFESLAGVDRDWDAEEKELTLRAVRISEKVVALSEEASMVNEQIELLRAEREAAGQ